MPFSLNRSADTFNFMPGDNTEWCVFTAKILNTSGKRKFRDGLLNSWAELALKQDEIRGSVSIKGALKNISNGVLPPKSGRENPHYFDDTALPRAVAIGLICSGDPALAAELSVHDACITNYEDGIYTAKFISAFVSMISSGTEIESAVESAIGYIPADSWTKRTIDQTQSLAKNSDSIFSVLPLLQKAIVNKEYSYGISSPETLALSLAIILKHSNDFEAALYAANSMPKNAERLPALVGAFAGALKDTPLLYEHWTEAVRYLPGICIPVLKGFNFQEFAENIANSFNQEEVK